MNNYRNQWSSITIPYQTISLGFDRQFYMHRQRFSGGLYIIYDNSGDAALTVNKIFLSIAYHKSLGMNNFHLAVQGGPVLKSYSINNLTFPDQYDSYEGVFDSSLPNYEANLGENLVYPDLNAGIIWDRKFRKIWPEIGIGVFHTNIPKESFNSETNKLPIRKVINAGARIEIGKKVYARPMAIWMGHKKATDLMAGSLLGFYLPENSINAVSIFTGAFFRDNFTKNFDASIFMIGMDFKHLQVGFSYDVNVSTLKTATNHKGAFEISVIFTSASTLIERLTVPCDRY